MWNDHPGRLGLFCTSSDSGLEEQKDVGLVYRLALYVLYQKLKTNVSALLMNISDVQFISLNCD